MATVASVTPRILLGLLTPGTAISLVSGSWGSGSVCVTDDASWSSTPPAGFPAAICLLDELTELPSTLLPIS